MKSGPSPLPRSSVSVRRAWADPLVSGMLTLSNTARMQGPAQDHSPHARHARHPKSPTCHPSEQPADERNCDDLEQGRRRDRQVDEPEEGEDPEKCGHTHQDGDERSLEVVDQLAHNPAEDHASQYAQVVACEYDGTVLDCHLLLLRQVVVEKCDRHGPWQASRDSLQEDDDVCGHSENPHGLPPGDLLSVVCDLALGPHLLQVRVPPLRLNKRQPEQNVEQRRGDGDDEERQSPAVRRPNKPAHKLAHGNADRSYRHDRGGEMCSALDAVHVAEKTEDERRSSSYRDACERSEDEQLPIFRDKDGRKAPARLSGGGLAMFGLSERARTCDESAEATYGISPRNTTVTNNIFLGIMSAR
eukprot:747942-Hanusia_phi.AAC.5